MDKIKIEDLANPPDKTKELKEPGRLPAEKNNKKISKLKDNIKDNEKVINPLRKKIESLDKKIEKLGYWDFDYSYRIQLDKGEIKDILKVEKDKKKINLVLNEYSLAFAQKRSRSDLISYILNFYFLKDRIKVLDSTLREPNDLLGDIENWLDL